MVSNRNVGKARPEVQVRNRQKSFEGIDEIEARARSVGESKAKR